MSTAKESQSASVRAWHMIMELWDEAAVQIDDSCRIIKLSSSTFSQLKTRGESFFMYRCSILLGKPAEFILDHFNNERVYLGNPAEVQLALDSVLVRGRNDRLPTLYRRTPPK